jgi:tetratricopeptide (TPR) repeat protein
MLAEHRPQGIVEHSLHAKHARALRRAGRYDEALAVAARGELQDPLSASARRELGKAHFALLQFEEALEAWQHTLWLTPNDPHLHWKVGFCHWSVAQDRRAAGARRASLEAAADCFERAATLFGVGAAEGWAWSQLWAGRVRAELGDHDAAVSHLRSATGCRPTEAAGALLLGEVYRALGEQALSRLQLARADTLTGLAPGPGNVDADWGETLTARELAVRARVGLGRWELEDDGDGERAVWRAEDASAVADQIEDERARARCLALAADLEASAHALARTAGAAAPVRP